MGKSEVLTNILSSAIVSSQSSCLANAENKILIDIGFAQNVNIKDVSIVQLATAESRCSQNVEIDVGSLEYDINKTLNASIQSAEKDSSTNYKLTTDISHAFNNDDVKSCLSLAVDEFKATFGQIGGDVNIHDLQISQVAQARISKCIQEGVFKVGEVPLNDYLVEALKSIEIVPPDDACPDAKKLYYALYGCVGAAVLIIAAVVLWNFLSRIKVSNP